MPQARLDRRVDDAGEHGFSHFGRVFPRNVLLHILEIVGYRSRECLGHLALNPITSSRFIYKKKVPEQVDDTRIADDCGSSGRGAVFGIPEKRVKCWLHDVSALFINTKVAVSFDRKLF